MEKKTWLCCSIMFAYLQVLAAANNSFFIFGDSFLDAGNNNYLNTTIGANFWPYGNTFFHFPTGRFSDGRLISDFLAEYAGIPLIASYLQPGQPDSFDGINFASSGAGALVDTNPGLVIDMHMQLKNYKKVEEWFISKLGDVGARKRFNRAVYMFSVGTNDYMSTLVANSSFLTSYTKSQYVDMVIGNLTLVINEIYKTGGRKFAFLNVPSIGCIPFLRILTRDGSCMEEASSYTILHNQALLQALKTLENQLPGFKYSLYDFYTSIQQRVDQPSTYGYTEGKAACCGSGEFRGILNCGRTRQVKEYELCNDVENYIFWDSIHLTEKAYGQFAYEMWSKSNNNTLSCSIKDLFHSP